MIVRSNMPEVERVRRIAKYRRKAAFFNEHNQFDRARVLIGQAEELEALAPDLPVERHAPEKETTAVPEKEKTVPVKRGRPRKAKPVEEEVSHREPIPGEVTTKQLGGLMH
jgi:hypothetical protein